MLPDPSYFSRSSVNSTLFDLNHSLTWTSHERSIPEQWRDYLWRGRYWYDHLFYCLNYETGAVQVAIHKAKCFRSVLVASQALRIVLVGKSEDSNWAEGNKSSRYDLHKDYTQGDWRAFTPGMARSAAFSPPMWGWGYLTSWVVLDRGEGLPASPTLDLRPLEQRRPSKLHIIKNLAMPNIAFINSSKICSFKNILHCIT